MADMPRHLTIKVDQIETTYGGLFGGPADTHRVFAPGLKHFLLDGVEVSQQEAEQAMAEDYPEEWARYQDSLKVTR